MTIQQCVQRDERTVAVENTSYRWACSFLVFALLIDVMCRAAFRNEAAWDLMALAIVPGIATLVYQARQKTLVQGWGWKLTLIGFIAGVLAAAIAIAFSVIRAM